VEQRLLGQEKGGFTKAHAGFDAVGQLRGNNSAPRALATCGLCELHHWGMTSQPKRALL
jgi:hypothetical protein